MRTNVLVTGANGQLAKCINELYQKNNEDISYIFLTKSELDISSQKELSNFFKDHDVQYCVNCAAYTQVDQAEEFPQSAFEINGDAVGKLAIECKKNNVILVHISTDYVFDGEKGSPYLEDDRTAPINIYGASKLKGEQLIEDILEKYYIIRASWLYSAYGKNFVKTIVRLVKENKQLSIVDSQLGSPTSCYDLSRFIHFLIVNKGVKFGIYHFSATNTANWYEFAKHITTHFPKYDKSMLKAVSEYRSAAKRPSYSVLSLDKTKKVYSNLGPWQESVDHVIEKVL